MLAVEIEIEGHRIGHIMWVDYCASLDIVVARIRWKEASVMSLVDDNVCEVGSIDRRQLRAGFASRGELCLKHTIELALGDAISIDDDGVGWKASVALVLLDQGDHDLLHVDDVFDTISAYLSLPLLFVDFFEVSTGHIVGRGDNCHCRYSNTIACHTVAQISSNVHDSVSIVEEAFHVAARKIPRVVR